LKSLSSSRYLVICITLLFSTLIALFMGCGGGQAKKTISECGSTTMQPLAEELAFAFMSKFPDVAVAVSGGGSSTGIKAVAEGLVDIGAASRKLTKHEEMAVIPHVIAYDCIAIAVHPDNKINGLTMEQLRAIYAGEITNWQEVGGLDSVITVVAREEGSGTRTAFEEMVMLGGAVAVTNKAILMPSNGAMRSAVAGDISSIGFVSRGYLDNSVKALKIDGFEPSLDNTRSGNYPIVRPLLFLTKKKPSGLVKEFLDFCLSPEGQAIVAKEYLPVK